MIKNFTDRDGKKFNIILRGRYSVIHSAKKLKSILDDSTNPDGLKKMYPGLTNDAVIRLSASYAKKPYMNIMRDFGMLEKSVYLGMDDKE